MNILAFISFGAFTILIFSSDQAIAQDKHNGVLEEIVVTASKTGAVSLQDIPASITAFTGDNLKESNLVDVNAISDFTPGLQLSANSNIAQITIRGIGSNTTLSGGETSSTIQVDGVYMARPSGALFDFMDVERIEVLRGPQGTLYGRNATGGTINIITNTPGNEFEFEGGVSYGTHNYKRINAAVRGAVLEDKMMTSLSVQFTGMDGFIKNEFPTSQKDIGGKNRVQLRGKLRFVPSEKVDVLLTMDYTDIDETQNYYVKPLLVLGMGESVFADLHTTSVGFDPIYLHEDVGFSGKVTVAMTDNVSLTSITAYRDSEMSISADLDATDIPFLRTEPLPENQDQFSQELQLNYNTENFDFISGLFYFRENVDSYFYLKIFPVGIAQMQGRAAETKALGIFGQGTYRFNDRLSATIGIRYSDEDKIGIASGGLYLLDETVLLEYENAPETMGDQIWSPKFGLDYKMNEDVMFYVSATRGYKAGGFNFISNPAEDGSFRPEKVWSYELGRKSSFADGRATLNLSSFYMDYNGLQVIEFLGAGNERVRNADAITKGIEAELVTIPTEGFTLAGTLALLDTKYDSTFISLDPISGLTIDANGNYLNNAPKLSGSIIAQYEAAAAEGTLSLRGELTFKGEAFYSPSNNNLERQSAYSLLNARIAWRSPDERWELSINGRNLGNKKYIEGAALFLGPTGRPALDRMIVGSVRVNF